VAAISLTTKCFQGGEHCNAFRSQQSEGPAAAKALSGTASWQLHHSRARCRAALQVAKSTSMCCWAARVTICLGCRMSHPAWCVCERACAARLIRRAPSIPSTACHNAVRSAARLTGPPHSVREEGVWTHVWAQEQAPHSCCYKGGQPCYSTAAGHSPAAQWRQRCSMAAYGVSSAQPAHWQHMALLCCSTAAWALAPAPPVANQL